VDHAPCDMVEDQEESKGLGVPGSIHRICQLEVVEGQYIELMEFAGVPSPNDEPLPLNQIGSQHISFVVDNLVSWVEKLNSHGIQFLYKPVPYYNPDESVSWWALFKDPDGIIVELLQL